MLNILSNVSAAAEGREWYESLVSINPVTIVFTLINLLIIFLIFRFLLYKPVCKMLDKRKEMAASEIEEARKA